MRGTESKSRDYFRPPPPEVLEKKLAVDLHLLYFYVHFSSVFVEFVVLLTKIW